MRIAVFEPYHESFGGAQKSLFLVAQEFLKRHDEVTLITPAGGKFLEAFANMKVNRIVVCPSHILDRFGGIYFRFTLPDFIQYLYAYILYNIRLSRLLRDINPNIVILNTPRAVAVAGLAATIANVPSILYFHGHEDKWGSIGRIFRYAIVRLPTAIISVSRATLSTIGSSSLVKTESHIVYNWLQDSFRQKCQESLLSKMHNSHEGKFVIGTLANIVPRKGQHVLIDAASHLRRMGAIDWRIEIAGKIHDQEYYEQLTRTIRANGLERLVEFVGYADPLEFLSKVDIFVLSSLSEGHPRCILEAMAMGKAIVSTDVHGISETIENGVSGYIVPLGDSGALAERINYLLANPELIRTLGIAARNLVTEKFTSQTQFPIFLGIIRDVAKRKQVRG